MPEITYQELSGYLADLDAARARRPPAVHLIHGEDLFVRLAFDDLLRRLLPGAQDSLNYEPFDGATAGVGDVLASLNTYSLLGGTKVVGWKHARLFHTRDDAGHLLETARRAQAEGDLPQAARRLLAVLAQLNLSLEQFKEADRAELLHAGYDPSADDPWIDRVLEHCTAGGLTVGAAVDAAAVLEQALAAGFPEGHYLIIATDLVDRRRSLYRLIAEKGTVIDCSAPRGDRRADKEAQEAMLFGHMTAVLASHGKTMDRSAFAALCEMTGFAPGLFSNNLSLLIDYAGSRRAITAEDVEAVLTRTKKDPVYEFTNALAERDAERALFFLGSLLEGELHGLQALAAIANQVRRLLVARDFLSGPDGAVWTSGCSYPQFQRSVMPAVAAFDRALRERREEWGRASAAAPAGGRAKKKAKAATDVVLAKNPASAFPVYQTLKKAEGFTTAELVAALQAVNEADLRLKSSPLHPRLILERLVLRICGGGAPKG